jgi:shikimate kinase
MLDEIEHVLAARDDFYRSLAHHTIDVDHLSPDAALAAITNAAASTRPTP